MQNVLQKENETKQLDEFEPIGFSGWIVFIFFFIPWLLGVGVVAIVLLDLLDIRLW